MKASRSVEKVATDSVRLHVLYPYREVTKPAQENLTALQVRKMLDRLMAVAAAARAVC